MPQKGLNVPDVNASLQQRGRKRVPIGYNKDKSEIPRKIKGNRVCLYSFSSKKRVVKSRKRVQ